MVLHTMRFCILIVRSSTTSGSFLLRWRALFVSPRSSSVAAADGGGEGVVCAVPCKADTTLFQHKTQDCTRVDFCLCCKVYLSSMQKASILKQWPNPTVIAPCKAHIRQCHCTLVADIQTVLCIGKTYDKLHRLVDAQAHSATKGMDAIEIQLLLMLGMTLPVGLSLAACLWNLGQGMLPWRQLC